MLTNKVENLNRPPYINQFDGIHQPGVVIGIDDKCIFTVLSGGSLIGRKSVADPLGNNGYLVWVDHINNIALLAQDRGLVDTFEAVQFAVEPLHVGDILAMHVQGGTISTQVVEQEVYQDDPSSVRQGHHYALVRQRAEAPMARLGLVLPSDMNGYAVVDTITGDLRGFTDTYSSRGGSTVNDLFYFQKGLIEAIDKFQDFYRPFSSQNVSVVLSNPEIYDAMRKRLACSLKTLGIDHVYLPNDDSLMLTCLPTAVDAAGNFIEPEYYPTEVLVDTAANGNKKLKDDYYKYKHLAVGQITLVSHTDFRTGDKIMMRAGGMVGNGGNGLLDDVSDWPVDDVIGPRDWVDTNNQDVHGFDIGRMITAIDRALSRYMSGTSIKVGVEWAGKTGVVARKVYQFDGLDQKTTDLINDTPVQRQLSEVSSLVKYNPPKYLPVIPGTTYLNTTELQAAIVTIPANTNRFSRYNPRAFLLFQGPPAPGRILGNDT